MNRAVHDDIVAVEVLPQQDWAIAFGLVIDDKDDDQGDLVIEQVNSFVKGVSEENDGYLGRNWLGDSRCVVEENSVVSNCCDY